MTPAAEDPGLEGPDYLALVIEWDGAQRAAVVEPIEDAPTRKIQRPRAARDVLAPLAAAFGAFGAFALAAWGIHRLRAA